jgi:hypothetical protein
MCVYVIFKIVIIVNIHFFAFIDRLQTPFSIFEKEVFFILKDNFFSYIEWRFQRLYYGFLCNSEHNVKSDTVCDNKEKGPLTPKHQNDNDNNNDTAENSPTKKIKLVPIDTTNVGTFLTLDGGTKAGVIYFIF